VPGLPRRAVVHCHDDLGLAVANSLAGVQAGARQVECAINGIGERAGQRVARGDRDAAATRAADLGFTTGSTRARSRARAAWSRASRATRCQPNKAIVGRNAFAHESGIHQDGVLKDRSTYEIMDATTIGLEATTSCSASTPAATRSRARCRSSASTSTGQALNTAFKRFKEIADKKKQVTAMDLEALVTDELRDELRAYTLEWFDVEASTRRPPHATRRAAHARRRRRARRLHRRRPGRRDLPRDQRRDRREARLREFRIDAVTGGQDALGEASVVLELAGQSAAGQGVSTDIIEAAGAAYVRALSNAERRVAAAPPRAEEPTADPQLTPTP
jgi:2-isopropylmalate synthase